MSLTIDNVKCYFNDYWSNNYKILLGGNKKQTIANNNNNIENMKIENQKYFKKNRKALSLKESIYVLKQYFT